MNTSSTCTLVLLSLLWAHIRPNVRCETVWNYYVPTAVLPQTETFKSCHYSFKLVPKNSKDNLTQPVVYKDECQIFTTLFKGFDSWKTLLLTRVTNKRSNSVLGLDAFAPIPTQWMGAEYAVVVHTASPGRSNYIAVFNVIHNIEVVVEISHGPHLTPCDLVIDGQTMPGDLEVTVPSNSTKYITAPGKDLYGVTLKGSRVFGVIAGSVSTTESLKPCHLVEMIPPLCFFSTSYIVPFDPEKIVLAKVVVQSLAWNTHVNITDHTSHDYHSLSYSGQVITVIQGKILKIVASNPILVMQYQHKFNADFTSAMCIIPPVSQWAKKFVILSLKVSGEYATTHYACIIINHRGYKDLKVIDIHSGRDVKPQDDPRGVQFLAYYQVFIPVAKHSILAIKHQTYPFVVVQYGISSDSQVEYSLPAPRLTYRTCRQTELINVFSPRILPKNMIGMPRMPEEWHEMVKQGHSKPKHIIVTLLLAAVIPSMAITLGIFCYWQRWVKCKINCKWPVGEKSQSFGKNCINDGPSVGTYDSGKENSQPAETIQLKQKKGSGSPNTISTMYEITSGFISTTFMQSKSTVGKSESFGGTNIDTEETGTTTGVDPTITEIPQTRDATREYSV